MKKIVRLGKTEIGRKSVDVFARIEIENGKLSIRGVEGPKANGYAWGSCGQIVMSRPTIKKCAPGWNLGLVDKFFKVWERWHLNDMRAGTPEQEKAIKEWTSKGNAYNYDKVCEHLKSIGIYEVAVTPEIRASALGGIDGDAYQYGCRWLHEELPDDVVAFLQSLPDADTQPAWV